jgi:hypothetical protein
MRLSAISKIAPISFFCLLSALFINNSSFANNNKSSGSNFIPPLVLSDYNSGTVLTNAGGLSGGDEEKPGITYPTIVSDDGLTLGNSGYSISVEYNVEKLGEYTFYWIKLGKELRDKSGVTEPLDLRKYNYLSFWIKSAGDTGNIKIEMHQDLNADGVFTFGADISSCVYADPYIKDGRVDRSWDKVVIPLKDFKDIKDWSKSSELVFVFENKAGNKKGTVYLDNILFGSRPENILNAKDTRSLKAPVESSFKVNGIQAKRCPSFNGTNVLSIQAEDIRDNPFIESVRFEYSTDKGSVWRTIGADYDVRKRLYRAIWHPDNTREERSYILRAVATDLRGKEEATSTLIECGVKPMTDDEFLDLVEKRAFEYFAKHQNPKTGLFSDTSGGGDASIAATGFGLAALCVGAEHKWIPKEEARKRAITALDTFLPQKGSAEPAAEGRYGFFYHFLNMNTAKRAGKAEISTVDTALLVAGALAAGEYFSGDVKKKAEEIYRRVEWGKFLGREKPWENYFCMGWSPERGYLDAYWDYYTDEVIIISLLAIGSPTYPVSPDVFYAWTRNKDSYGSGKSFIYTWHGALFSYQYANIWYDFQNIADRQGVNWFENSINATLANRQFCIDNADKFKSYGPNSWGITSMSRPEGYTMHFGTPPCGSGEPQYDGTVSPTGPAGSIVFTPILSMSAIKYMYIQYPRLWGQYGLRDSFNINLNWYAPTYYGIGVAMILLPMENFRHGFIWKNFMKNKYVKESLVKAGFTKARKR